MQDFSFTMVPQKIAPVNFQDFSAAGVSEELVDRLTSSISDKLDTLPAESYSVCIFRVPDKRRKTHEEAYTPRLVSIGPLHHGKNHLQAMEVLKLKSLKNFLTRYSVDLKSLVKFTSQEEKTVRGCYEDTIELSSDAFTEMVLLDGIFVIELFLKNHFFGMREHNDILFENRWISNDLLHDMLLLENQIPLSFTNGLFSFVDASALRQFSSFYDFVKSYFKNVGHTGTLEITDGCRRATHLVEFLIFLHKPLKPRDEISLEEKFEYTHSATELQAAGVKFHCGSRNCLFEASFINGELRLPHLIVNETTETFFRNAVAFEQCGYYSKDMTSYVILMDSLINTPEDVDLLVKKGVIENQLGEIKKVADLFNSLYKEVMSDNSYFYFAKLCRDLNGYSRDYWHEWKSAWFKWKVILGRDYFGNPWSLISVIAAVVIIILTVIQTVCSVLQVV